MGLYVSLYKLTEQGIKNVKDAPARIEAAIKAAEAIGGKVISVYSTMGEYDYVSISDFPTDESAATFVLKLGSTGNVSSTTMKAFDVDQFTEIVSNIP